MYLKIKRLGQLKKHLGVWWEWKTGPNTREIYLQASMPKMVQEIKEAYVDAMGVTVKPVKIPSYPGKNVQQAMDDDKQVKTTEYQSLVGKLMYYMMKVGPKLTNAVRDLVGHMAKLSKEHWQAVAQVVGYITSKPYQGVTF